MGFGAALHADHCTYIGTYFYVILHFPETRKLLGNIITTVAPSFLQYVLEREEVPEGWYRAKVVSIFKMREKTDRQNYRSISLFNSSYKIYAKIPSNSLCSTYSIKNKTGFQEQKCFRQGCLMIDGIFTLQQVIEKRREFHRETHCWVWKDLWYRD